MFCFNELCCSHTGKICMALVYKSVLLSKLKILQLLAKLINRYKKNVEQINIHSLKLGMAEQYFIYEKTITTF